VVSVPCPSCGRSLHFRKATQAGARLTCPGCGTRLEVLATTPMELDWAFDGPIQDQVEPLPEALDELDIDDGLAKSQA
jgi:DNA-directed RNA polymerase subunit RPC12/RpoP